jgi:U3 small nucleolar RNA-associated protein 13
MKFFALQNSDDQSIEPVLLRTVKPHSSPVVTSSTDSTGTLLATGSADGTIKVWDIRGGFVTHTFHGNGGIISALLFFEVSPEQFPTESQSLKKRKSRSQLDRDREIHSATSDLSSSTMAFRLASGSEDGKIKIWDLHKRKALTTLESHVSIVRSLRFSSHENALLSASRDKTATVWDAKTWKIRKVVPILETVEAAGFLQEGRFFYTGGEHGRVRIWETDTGQEATNEQEPGPENDSITAIEYSVGLTWLMSMHADQTIRLHTLGSLSNLAPGKKIGPLPILRRISGNHDEIIDLAYVGANQSLLALATNSESIRIVSLNGLEDSPNEETSKLGPETSHFGADVAHLEGHEEIIISLDIDWSGHWLATGAKDNTAKLWRIDPQSSSYTCVGTFTGHAESIGAISLPHTTPPTESSAHKDPLNHPPSFVLTGSQDRTIKRWDTSKLQLAKTPQKPTRAVYTRKAHDKDINAIDTNHNSTLFASASQDRTVKIWSTEEGEVQGVLRGHRRGVWSVRFSPKETPTITGDNSSSSGSRGLILTGSGDKTVKIWSLSDYTCLRTFEGHTNSVLKVLWMPSPTNTPHARPPQVASAAADGLVKVWDTATTEALTTLDNHTDRIWALAANPKTGILISGGADSVITFWRDTSSATLETATARQTALIEQDQELQNLIHSKSYRDAIVLALQLNHPHRLLALFTSVVNNPNPDADSLSGNLAVDKVLASLAPSQLYTLLLRLRDWNTNARTAPVAQRILYTLVKSYPASTFTTLQDVVRKEGVKGGDVGSVIRALKAYSERHLRRMEELVDESFLVEFVLGEMEATSGVDASLNGKRGDEDVIMV